METCHGHHSCLLRSCNNDFNTCIVCPVMHFIWNIKRQKKNKPSSARSRKVTSSSFQIKIQSNFNGSNTFGTKKVSLRQGISLIFYNMEVCCVFSLESPHWGDSNEYTQYTIFSIKKKITLNFPKSAAMDFFQGTQERVWNSQGKRAIRVRAIEVLL